MTDERAVEHELVIRDGTVRRRDRCPGPDGRRGDRRRQDHPRRTRCGPGPRGARRRGGAGDPRFRRCPYPLRRPGHLGPGDDAVVVARGDHHGLRQLRGRVRPGPARRARVAHPANGGGRGYSRRGAGRRDRLAVGDVPRVPRRARADATGPWTSPPRCPTGRSGPTSWATGAPATRTRPRPTSRPWPPSSGRPWGPAPSASPRPGRCSTVRSTASRCRARSPATRRSPPSVGPWPTPVAGWWRSPPTSALAAWPASSATTSTGCATWRRSTG